MKRLYLIFSYLKYWLKAKNQHGIHSPFVFDLYNEVIRSDAKYYSFANIESIRAKMLLNNNSIEITDLGAGSVAGNGKRKKISDIAKNAAKQKKYGTLLFRLVNHFQPTNIIELGTSLGISTLYLASAVLKNKVATIEGCPQTAAIAKENFSSLKLQNIQLYVGSFEEKLPEVLRDFNADFVFFDGNHRKQATLKYFKLCLEKSGENSVFVFDDIHWSAEMTEAWQEIKQNEKVSVSIDLFFVGIVFFKRGQRKEHFVLRY